MPKRKTAHRKTRKVIRVKWFNLALLMGAVLFLMFYSYLEASEIMLSPQGDTPPEVLGFVYASTPTPEPTATPAIPSLVKGKRATEADKQAVEAYIRQVFGEAGKLAVAVAKVEGWPHAEDQGWDRTLCWHRVENGRHKGEYSVGPFQINLVQGCNAEGKRIHWNRIPGDTFEEKVEWLSNPFNNIDIAHQIYREQGWGPWTGYTSNAYLKYL